MPEAPPGLAALQQAFAAAMRAPLDITDTAGNYRLPVADYPAAITDRIRPDRGQGGAVRLSTYNQQYWFRLLTVLQEEYPLLRHLLGVTEFNRMGVDYLTAHPSTAPSLRHLSDALVGFLTGSATWGRPERVQCARMEYAYIQAFDAEHRLPIAMTAAALSTALSAPLRLQPHLTLFQEDWDLVDWRARVRQDDDDAIPVTLQAKTTHWAIWRGRGPGARKLGTLQYRLLQRLAAGEPLAEACAGLAQTLDEAETAFVMENIQGWFARWAGDGWFCG